MDETGLLGLAEMLRAVGYRFTTPTPATHAVVNARPENAWARGIADVFGWSRPFRDGVVPAPLADLMRAAGVLRRDGEGWRSAVRLSTLDGMLFLHSAFPTDAADSVFFGPDTYRFGAAILAWLDRNATPVRRAVDIGCGAGPGALLMARSHPGAEVFGVDINEDALTLTRVNARLAGLPRVVARHSDLLGAVEGEFDLIVSNPPYLADPARRAYRHGGGELGADLSIRILEAAIVRLAPGGTLLLYTGAAIVDGHDPVEAAMTSRCRAAGLSWMYREIDPDVFGDELLRPPYVMADRIAAVLLTARRDGNNA